MTIDMEVAFISGLIYRGPQKVGRGSNLKSRSVKSRGLPVNLRAQSFSLVPDRSDWTRLGVVLEA